MTLDKFIEGLQKLQAQGYGNAKVFYSHGASGDRGPLSSAFVEREPDPEFGPFDLKEGEAFISVYAGN